MKKRWILIAAAVFACCGADRTANVQIDLHAQRLQVYRGEELVAEQPIACVCAAPPVGEWVIEGEDANGYRLSCPWGTFYLTMGEQVPVGTRVLVDGPRDELCPVQPGSRGAAVWRMQQGLRELGYLDEEPTGICDARTCAAAYAWFGREPGDGKPGE